MSRVFEGPIHVDYRQAYVLPYGQEGAELYDCFRGQSNGICGAAVQGELFLITGLHMGYVHFTVDILDAPPPLDDIWEEIVEVSLLVKPASEMLLEEWGGEVYPIPLPPGSYRVRYCARGMDLGHQSGVCFDEQDIVDFYALAFWPAEFADDCVIKRTSANAQYWHEWVHTLGLDSHENAHNQSLDSNTGLPSPTVLPTPVDLTNNAPDNIHFEDGGRFKNIICGVIEYREPDSRWNHFGSFAIDITPNLDMNTAKAFFEDRVSDELLYRRCGIPADASLTSHELFYAYDQAYVDLMKKYVTQTIDDSDSIENKEGQENLSIVSVITPDHQRLSWINSSDYRGLLEALERAGIVADWQLYQIKAMISAINSLANDHGAEKIRMIFWFARRSVA